MEVVMTVVGLLVLAAWAVLWVVTSAALVANEPAPARKTPIGTFARLHRPAPRGVQRP